MPVARRGRESRRKGPEHSLREDRNVCWPHCTVLRGPAPNRHVAPGKSRAAFGNRGLCGGLLFGCRLLEGSSGTLRWLSSPICFALYFWFCPGYLKGKFVNRDVCSFLWGSISVLGKKRGRLHVVIQVWRLHGHWVWALTIWAWCRLPRFHASHLASLSGKVWLSSQRRHDARK